MPCGAEKEGALSMAAKSRNRQYIRDLKISHFGSIACKLRAKMVADAEDQAIRAVLRVFV